MTFRLERRTFLRGTGGIAVALPVLECMLNEHGTALADTGARTPCRFAMVMAGQALGGDGWPKNQSRINGQNITEDGHFIAPSQFGAGYDITTPLEPLAALTDEFSIVSNLRIPFNSTSSSASAVPDGGAFRGFHGGGASPLLSGVKSTTNEFVSNGITGDQVIAGMQSGSTTFESLVYRAQAAWYLSGSSFNGRQHMSYRGAGQPVEAQTSPQVAYMSLFSNFTPDNAADIARLDFALRSRRSVLDLVLSKRQAIEGKLGAADRQRLEKHYDELRDLEMRLVTIDPTAAACEVPEDPGDDPPIGGNNAGATASEIQPNTGYSDEERRAKLFADLIHMAFTCDLTRVATLQITCFQSHMNVHALSDSLGIPILADLHEMGHNGDPQNKGQLASSTCLKWHIDHYAYLLQKMKDTEEGAGTLLDNSAIVFFPEAGHGTNLDDATTPDATHSLENMCMLVAGRAGGLSPGRHIDGATAHPVNVTISAMQAVGYEGDSLGEVQGRVDDLFGP